MPWNDASGEQKAKNVTFFSWSELCQKLSKQTMDEKMKPENVENNGESENSKGRGMKI